MTTEGEIDVDVTMETRGLHDVAMNQGMLAATRNWKSQGTDSLLDPLVGTSP